MKHDKFLVAPGHRVSLAKYDTASTGKFSEKGDAAKKLDEDIASLSELQNVLYASDSFSLLLIFQAMDAAGKDSVIKHVMSGVNPQGCMVTSFKAPSAEELNHDFLWRCSRALPARGMIGIFNRSYYEEVLVVRVHPNFLAGQKIPPSLVGKDLWKHRYDDINGFEQHLVRNGTVVLKFFLHVSQDEQKKRFLERIETPEKNWKFSTADLPERDCWKDYMKAYEEMLGHTSTAHAPWYIIPADHKWFTRTAVADIIVKKLRSLPLAYPTLDAEQKKRLAVARKKLENEK